MAEARGLQALLAGALRRVFGAENEIRSCRPLSGGTESRAYLLGVRATAIVAKLPDRGTAACVGAKTEFDIMQKVAEAGLGPAALGFDAATGILFSEYRADAQPWSREQAATRTNIERLAAVLRELHGLAANLRPFEPEAIAGSYLDAMCAAARRVLGPLATELKDLACGWSVGSEAVALCHNDLVAANVLDDGRLWLIDFEYAVSAPPIVDLASLAAMNEYGLRQMDWLLDAYYGRDALPYERRVFARVVRIHELIAEFWHALRRPG